MKIGRLFPDLLATLGRAASPEAGFARTLRQLVALSGATCGGLVFRPRPGASLTVTAGARRGSALDRWLRERLAERVRGVRREALADPPSGWRGGGKPVLLRAPLGAPGSPLGQFLLLGAGGRRGFAADAIPSGFPREFGRAMEQVWRLHQRTLRLEVINEVTALSARTVSPEHIYDTVAEAVGRLVRFDALSVAMFDRERDEIRVLDMAACVGLPEGPALRLAPADTLAAWVAERRMPRRVDDLSDPSLPPVSREILSRRRVRSVIVVPLFSQGDVIGTLNAVHHEPRAFTDADVEVLMEVARPLASAVVHTRLHAEIVQRAEELAALNRTSQLITARLDLRSVLAAISRSVTGLMASTGCGIGLFNADRTAIDHAAAHGFRTPEWRLLSVPVGEGIIGRAAASGQPVRADDLRADPRSTQRDIDEKEGMRSMLSVPLRVAGEIIGVISAFSTTPGFFTDRHPMLLEAFADQAGAAIQNARLFEESQRRARETQALLEAGRAVNQSLDVEETIRLILTQAREVLGVESCGLMTLDAATGELSSVASLDLDPAVGARIRIRVGQGITGLAVQERRPVQSADLSHDPRARYPQLHTGGAMRSMLATPLIVGDQAIGALTVLRRDVHRFTPEEESLAAAFADQAATALERARLFSSVRTYSEQLEAMVAARTREVDEQKRFVEVVLEALPLGLFVLDAEFRVVSANREGAALLPFESGGRRAFVKLLPAREGTAHSRVSDGRARRPRGAADGGGDDRRRGDAHLSPHGGAPARIRRRGDARDRADRGHHRAEAPRAPDAPDRAAEHGRAARRGGGSRAQQSARDDRGLRRVAGGARPRPRARGARRLQGFPGLPGAHRGRGLPLQGDHRKPPAVRARSGQPPGARRDQWPHREVARALEPPAAVRREPARHGSRRRRAARSRQ